MSVWQRIEQLKVMGEYYRAGQLAREHNMLRHYGCHFGMRHTRNDAVTDFYAGYDGEPSMADLEVLRNTEF